MDGALHPNHLAWLEARGISSSLAEKFGLKTMSVSFPPDGEEEEWVRAKGIAIPYLVDGKVVNHKYRRVEPKQHVMDKGGARCLWNMDAVKRAAGGTLVITEGEWDAMVADDLGWLASSVPNGTPKKSSDDPANDKRYEYLWEARDDLTRVERFILATDGDAPGIALRTDLIALLGPVKCAFLDYPEECKDLTDVRVKHGVEAVSLLLNNAKPVPVSGLHTLSEFPDAPALTLEPILNVDAFDELFGLVEATWTPITGFPGHGKSSLVMKLVANLIASGKHVTMASFETMPKPILERRILACLCDRNEHDLSIWHNYAARRIMEDRLAIIANTPDEEHELSIEALLDLCEASHRRFNTDLVVIDPWNEIEHKRGRDESETDYTGRAIRMMKRWCHRTRVPMWMVAHPKKPSGDGVPKYPPSLYDISGSANWYNKADYGIIVHRPDLTDNIIEVNCSKVRMGLPGKVGKCQLRYEAAMSRYLYVPMIEDE